MQVRHQQGAFRLMEKNAGGVGEKGQAANHESASLFGNEDRRLLSIILSWPHRGRIEGRTMMRS